MQVGNHPIGPYVNLNSMWAIAECLDVVHLARAGVEDEGNPTDDHYANIYKVKTTKPLAQMCAPCT